MQSATPFRGPVVTFDAWLLVLLLVVGTVLSSFIPPFQSPDEFDHVKRAYLLTRGQIFLESHADSAAGGEIDSGMLAYMRIFKPFPFQREKKLSQEEHVAASSISWTGTRAFSEAPGTGYYLPIVYLPQAIALGIGELGEMTIDQTYRLARFFVLLTSLAILFIAFSIFPTNAFILGLLVLPMSLFQFVSASIDGVTSALTCLVTALFMRAYLGNQPFTRVMCAALFACLLILTTSRIQLLPLLALPFFLWIKRQERLYLGQFFALAVFCSVWTLLAVRSSYVIRSPQSHSTSDVLSFYLTEPVYAMDALVNTLQSADKLTFYRNSFIGILGWLDTPFDSFFYETIMEILVVLAALSISFKGSTTDWPVRLLLIVLACGCTTLVFLSMLLTWSSNEIPATVIEGVQGRYFIGPSIVLGYALSGSAPFLRDRWNRMSILPLLILLGMICIQLPQVLAARYLMVRSDSLVQHFTFRPSRQLHPTVSIPILMTAARMDDPTPLKRIGIQFGTYGRLHPGGGELHLLGPNGVSLVHRFSLSEVKDNEFMYLTVGDQRFTHGFVTSIDGGHGISSWESESDSGDVATCIKYEYVNDERRSTPGCQR